MTAARIAPDAIYKIALHLMFKFFDLILLKIEITGSNPSP